MVRTLFVDPASISSGWAEFEDDKCVKSGSVVMPQKLPAPVRLRHIFWEYIVAFSDYSYGAFESVHIERLPRNCHHLTHWSCGVIASALSIFSENVQADISPTSWQKSVQWKKPNKSKPAVVGSELSKFKSKVKTEDELAAIGMGLHFFKVKRTKD